MIIQAPPIRRPARLAAVGGGTAGHVYPALAIVEAWRKLVGGEPEVLYLGSDNGMERTIVERTGVAFHGIKAGPFRVKNPTVIARSTGRLVYGVGQAWRALSSFHADALLATGGYVSFPVALGARLAGVPVVLYLPDIEPGWAVRALAPLATRIAVTAEASRSHLPASKVAVTGYPVRKDLCRLDKSEARRRLGLDADLPTVLILGGSRGADSINRAVGEALAGLLRVCQVVHICGAGNEQTLRARASTLEPALAKRYALYPYLHAEFPWALAAADLAVSRSGASVMGEYPAVGLPSILVPYPHAGSHQEQNALYLSQAGAAVVLRNGKVQALDAEVKALLSDPDKLAGMARNAGNLSRPHAAGQIACLLVESEGRHG